MKTIMRFTAVLGMLALSSTALALGITPGDATWQGSVPNNPDADDVETIVGTSTELESLYKNDCCEGGVAGADVESGSFAGSYSTAYFNDPDDPSEATISYDGPTAIDCSVECYLVVKDGNQDPIWYIFDLNALGWDGEADLVLTGFWPAQGAISHVDILGGPGSDVPEPGTMALLGLGLFGMGLMRRRRTS